MAANYVQPLISLKAAATVASPTGLPAALCAIALTVVEAIVASKNTKDDLHTTAARISEVASNLIVAISRPDVEADPVLTASIERVVRSLESLAVIVKKHLSKGRIQNFISSSSSKITVKQAQQEVHFALEEVDMHLRMSNVRISERNSSINLEAVKELLNQAQKEQLSAIQEEVTRREKLRSGLSKQVLPAVSAVFYGRQKELELTLPLLEKQEQAAIAILGSGGIGKTSLALSLMHRENVAKRFEDRRYFIACDALEKVDAITERFGMTLGVSEKRPLVDLRRIVEEDRKPVLITLDNLETPWEAKSSRAGVEAFLSDLVTIPMVSVIITLRGAERPGGVAWSRPFLPPIAPLDLEAAIDVFTSIADITSDDPYMIKLILAVDLVPLAITLIAHQAQYMSCQDLFEIWSQEKTRMVSRGAPYADGRLTSLDASIQVSLDSPRFKQEPDALRLLQLLSILPDGAPDWLLTSLTAGDFALKAATTTLLRVSLAMRDGQGNLTALSPVREYISSHLSISEDDLQPGLDYLERECNSWMASWGTDESKKIRTTWKSQSGNIISFIREKLLRPCDAPPAALAKMIYRLRRMLRGYIANQSLESILEDVQKVQGTDSDLQAIQTAIRLDLDDFDSNRHGYEKFDSLIHLLLDYGDPEVLAIGLADAALTALYGFHDSPKVVSLSQQLLRVDIEKIPIDALVHSHSEFAIFLRRVGQPGMALQMLRRAKAIVDTKNLDSQSTMAIERGLANLDVLRGAYSRCHRDVYKFLDFTEVSQLKGQQLLLLMTIASHRGHLSEAESVGALAYQIFSLLSITNGWNATALWQLCIIYLNQGRLPDALNTAVQYRQLGTFGEVHMQRQLEIMKLSVDPGLRLSSSPEVGKGRSFDHGELFYRMGRMEAAFPIFLICIIRESRAGYRLGVSMLLLRIGDYFRGSEGDMITAEACYRASLQTIDFIGTPIHQADAVERVALCQEYNADLEAAATSLSRAKTRLSLAGITHQIEALDRKIASLGVVDKQLLFSFDAAPPPTLVGSWTFTYAE